MSNDDRDQLAEILREATGGYTRTPPFFHRVAEKVIDAGWLPPAREITTAADLDALQRGSVILLDYDVILQAVLDWEDVENPSCWLGVGEGAPILTSSQVIEAAGKGATITVLHTPAEVSDGECDAEEAGE